MIAHLPFPARARRASVSFASVLVILAGLLLVGCSDEPAPTTRTAAGAPASDAPADVAPAEPAVETLAPVPVPEITPGTVTNPPPAPATPSAPAAPATPAPAASAREPQQFEVLGVVTQWKPAVLYIQPGDRVVFRQMTGHDTETVAGMIPEGAEGWKSQLGEEGYSVTLEVPGAYVYKCNPHVSMGMLGAIVVGDLPPTNLEQIKASPDNKGMIGRTVRKLEEALNAAQP